MVFFYTIVRFVIVMIPFPDEKKHWFGFIWFFKSSLCEFNYSFLLYSLCIFSVSCNTYHTVKRSKLCRHTISVKVLFFSKYVNYKTPHIHTFFFFFTFFDGQIFATDPSGTGLKNDHSAITAHVRSSVSLLIIQRALLLNIIEVPSDQLLNMRLWNNLVVISLL